MPGTPQLLIYLDADGRIHCEAPGINGARRKIDLSLDFAQRNPELMLELQTTRRELLAKQRAELQSLQTKNINYVIQRHGSILAGQVWRDGELTFNRALKRYLKRIATPEAPKPKSKARQQKQETYTLQPHETIDVEDLL